MNKFLATGRFTSDPTIRYANNDKQTCIANFTLAINRRFKREGEPDADFIRCVAMGKVGEFVEKYFHKGMKADITAHIQTGSYQNKDGQTVYTTDAIIEEIDFGESKASTHATSDPANNSSAPADNSSADEGGFDGFEVAVDDSELPFN